MVIASVSEGFDKPYKYSGMFAAAEVVILNKADLMEVFEFDMAYNFYPKWIKIFPG